MPSDPPLPSEAEADPASGWRPALQALGVSALCLMIGALVMLAVSASSLQEQGTPLPEPLRLVLLIDLLVGIVCAIAVGPMRRAGTWNLLIVASTAVSGTSIAAGAVALARIGERRTRRLDATAIGVVAVCAVVNALLLRWAAPGSVWTIPWEVLLSLAFAGASLLWGRARGTRAALITSLRAQTLTAQREKEALEREHAALMAQARSEQRAAIARDMHDSLSHHLSLIAMHAGALEYRDDLRTADRRAAAGTIRASAQAANAELREVLSALRADGAPLPTAADLSAMVEEARQSGHRVHLRWSGGPFEAACLDRAGTTSVVTMVRITRELLTNARRHAAGETLELDLDREGEELVLRARNPAPSSAAAGRPGSGLGLVGVRERIRLLGGTLQVTGRAGTDFEVEARLPWRQ
ncbi:sensor histidine kinase [Brachybacterium hainanense]|uniref:histidine kinase n=1 Tax=Brachybacterium hainanense TaxID=1541174 RepID=A0ABV6RD36_9MICO